MTCAAIEEHKQCDAIDNHIPDMMGKSEQLVAIGEAKTCNDLDNKRTEEQFKAFGRRVMKPDKTKRVPFYIAIPKECESKLNEVLMRLNLDKRENIKVVAI